MIIGIIHKGSGLGDQLFSYIATRVRAADLGVDFGFVGKEFFKGASFMNLDWGKEALLNYDVQYPEGKTLIDYELKDKEWPHFVLNKPYYDPEFNFIPDGSVIDGYGAQDIRYFEHRLDEVRKWLSTEWLTLENTCVINFRGGEYQAVPELFLPKEYWDEAIVMMKEKYPNIRFEVHTDDPNLALQFFSTFDIISGIDVNWRAVRWAKHLIISNSAFAILPALLNENVKEVIAPKYWNRRNIGKWDWPGNYYKKFQYI